MVDVVVVGPCAAGKSTLAKSLRTYGFSVQPIAQEHSGVAGLWQRHPTRALIFLDVELAQVHKRGRASFPAWLQVKQRERLKDARAATDFYLDTSPLSIEDVLQNVLTYLQEHGIKPTSL